MTGLFLLSLIGCATSATQTRCFPTSEGEGGSSCFIQPDPLVSLPWSSAMDWCKDIGATLPTPDDYTQHNIYANVLDYLGLHTETLWLGANSTYDPNNWHWTNGTRFTGTIENGNVAGKTQAYIVRYGTNVRFVAASPFESHSFICNNLFSERRCATYPDSYWTGSSCKSKYTVYYTGSSYNAWQFCQSDGLAVIENLDEFSRWMDNSTIFWIGLRSAWWTWYDSVAGTSREVFGNRFSYKLPNGTSSGECLASFREDRSNIEWMNLDCARNLPFVCQKLVNSSTSTTTASSSASSSSSAAAAAAATTLSSTARTSISSTTTTTTVTPTITTQRTSSTSVATTPTSVTTTATIPTSTPKTTASSSASTTTTSASNPFMTPATSGVTVDSSEPTADVTIHQISDRKSTLTNHDLAIGVGVGVALFLLMIIWLAALTVYGFWKMREVNDSLKLLQRQKNTSNIIYDNRAFNNA